MIYFITNCSLHLSYYREKQFDDILVLEDNEDTFTLFKEYIYSNDINVLGYDVESTGLDAWKSNTVLSMLGDEEVQFVFHSAHCEFKKYYKACWDFDLTLLGHNIKFDIKFGFTEQNILYTKVWDTMLAEQRIFMKSRLSFSLENLCIRYLDLFPDAMDKSIRMEFVGNSPSKMKIEPRHIRYGAGDVSNLFPIKRKQEIRIAEYKMEFLVYDIEFKLIPIIAKAELTGFVFNIDKWIEIYKDNLKKKFELELELDTELRRLRDLKYGTPDSGLNYFPEKRNYLVGGKWDNPRKRTLANDIFNDDGTTNVLDLFGKPMTSRTYTGVKKKVKLNPNNVNYESDTQIVEIFARLTEPLPTKQDSFVIPEFNKKGKIDKTHYNFTTQEGALLEYLSDLPNSIMKDFITLLLKHRSYSTACNNFGIKYKEKINPITGKLHTTFRQCFADTGRFQSGGGKLEDDKPNFQNIPSKAKYAIAMRNCFMAREGYSIGTHDLSGAELIIMCSLSQDLKLLEIALRDIHSYVAQGCWRIIYAVRAKKLITNYNKEKSKDLNYFNQDKVDKINEYIDKSKNYIVNKKTEGGKVRTNFKPMTFGTIYGMFAAKAGKTLNIIKEEGQLVINFIKNEFPDVFKMVESASAFARQHGYIILNKRTNSRAWFPNIINVIKGRIAEGENWKLISKEMSEARNIRIQGTQADMIKEMSVVLQDWIDDNGYTNEITILSWVHDEIVDEHPKYMNGRSKEWSDWTSIENMLVYNNKLYTNFPEIKQQIMRDVANEYLENVTMDADYDVEPYWTK